MDEQEKVETKEAPEQKESTETPAAVPPTKEELLQLIQSEVAKATKTLSKEKDTVENELAKLREEKLTDDERKELALGEKERAIAEREKTLLEKENRLYAMDALSKAGLNTGADSTQKFVDFVLAEEKGTIDEKVKNLAEIIKTYVAEEVEQRFKDGGRNLARSTDVYTENPYSKEHFNITKQMEIETENPEMAKAMKAAAGV